MSNWAMITVVIILLFSMFLFMFSWNDYNLFSSVSISIDSDLLNNLMP